MRAQPDQPFKPQPRLVEFPRYRNNTYKQLYQLGDTLERFGMQVVQKERRGGVWHLARHARRLRLIRPIGRLSDQAYIVPCYWGRCDHAFPLAYRNPIIPLCNDCWEPQFPQWEQMLRQLRPPLVLFTARLAGEYFSQRIRDLNWAWLPEAIDPAVCTPDKPLAERSVDLVEYGRTLPGIRRSSRSLFDERGYVYRGSEHGRRLTRTPAELHTLLADAKLAVCFPKTMTTTDGVYAAGRVETMTYRYLEVIASGCLPYGRCPAELRDLFGFDPVIHADLDDPAGQLDVVLSQIDDYQDLAERSYQRLLEVGSWDARVRTLFGVLHDAGYQTPALDRTP